MILKSGTIWALTTMGKHSEREQSAVEFSPSPDDWRLRGACVGMDPDLFIAGPTEHFPAMLEARKACLWCPVFKECGRSATAGDDEYALRAGRIPDEQSDRLRGRPARRVTMLDRGQCGEGHVLRSSDDLSGDGRCLTCRREKDRERKRGAGKRTTCSKGHRFTPENTYAYVRQLRRANGELYEREVRECVTCKLGHSPTKIPA